MPAKLPTINTEAGFTLVTNPNPGRIRKVRVEWRLAPEFLASLAKDTDALQEIMVLIIVVFDTGREGSSRYTETARHLLPITQKTKKVRLAAPGNNIVRAVLVWPLSDADLERALLWSEPLTSYYVGGLVYFNKDPTAIAELGRRGIGCSTVTASKEFDVGEGSFATKLRGLAKAVLEWGQKHPRD